ncbi:MAG: S41 family peptidase [Candidatus Pacebacteria bacterium]|nr:S41 family peptidase [Candidatus Paceibacterota bacterium]
MQIEIEKQFKVLFKKIPLIVIGVILIILSFYLGIKYEDNQNDLSNILNKDLGKETEVSFETFWQSWNVLEEKFVSNGEHEIDDQAKVWGAIQGLASSFKDPYTVFMPPADSAIFEGDIAGNFEGVGMEIGIRNNVLMVVAPLKNTPAERAGIMPQDIILEIDGISALNMSTDEAVKIIRGEKGTEVKLLIKRKEVEKSLEISIIRDVIDIPIIETKIKDNVFIINLYSFTANSPDLFREALRKFIEANTDKLIIDLRGNPGGYLEVANDIASWFLPMGKVVVTEDYGENKINKVHSSRGYDIFNESLKMAILINGGSASASEILAGALSEHGKATLIGTQSFGKGSVQELVKITPETSLKVTVARWLTPLGNSISHNGLEPDIEVEITIEDIKEDRDPQIDKAVEYLNAL